MTSMPEIGRLAAHVYLDAVTAFDDEHGDHPDNTNAMNLAIERMHEIGAVTATSDDETGAVDVDASNLIGAALVSMKWLVGQVAVRSGRSEQEVIVELREFLDDDA